MQRKGNTFVRNRSQRGSELLPLIGNGPSFSGSQGYPQTSVQTLEPGFRGANGGASKTDLSFSFLGHEERTSFLRSEPMEAIQLLLQVDAAHDIIEELISMECLQFLDLNEKVALFQRKFVKEVRRWDEAERKIRYFEEELKHHAKRYPVDSNFSMDGRHTSVASLRNTPTHREALDEMEGLMDGIEKELQVCHQNEQSLWVSIRKAKEFLHVLDKEKIFFENESHLIQRIESDIEGQLNVLDKKPDVPQSFSIPMQGFLGEETETGSSFENPNSRLKTVAGVIVRENVDNLCRLLWRSSRGNIYIKTSDIDEPIYDVKEDTHVSKTAFIVFMQGSRLQTKVTNICTSLQATLYECPMSLQERRLLREAIAIQLKDLQITLGQTIDRRRFTLAKNIGMFSTWKTVVSREKMIYHVMNMTRNDIAKMYLVAEAWCPATAIPNIMFALRKGTERCSSNIPSILNPITPTTKPPTYYKLNALSGPFQAMVDAYGVASFGEINPAPFSIITFPFLFALMFGDVGHGFLLFFYALYLIHKQKKPNQLEGVYKSLAEARYMILLMGFFSVYTGMIYGEFFSVPFKAFSSMWEPIGKKEYKRIVDRVYPFGIDPIWIESGNMLDFFNSVKMKLSIIFGVLQMILGLFLSMLNHIHFERKLSVYVEFIPQILFMTSIFGYMVFLIIYKWAIDWTGKESLAPSLINTMIDMFLQPGKVNAPLYSGQAMVQVLLLVVSCLCIPVLLFGKPLAQRMEMDKRRSNAEIEKESDEKDKALHNFWDDMTHQTIHTIEFVLGAVSNTASYLRIWALSLAHSELSKVFWEQIMEVCWETKDPAIISVGFIVWLFATIGILMGMESLSAFLHALRLHWVEFQNKFYVGDGVQFTPVTFNDASPASSTM